MAIAPVPPVRHDPGREPNGRIVHGRTVRLGLDGLHLAVSAFLHPPLLAALHVLLLGLVQVLRLPSGPADDEVRDIREMERQHGASVFSGRLQPGQSSAETNVFFWPASIARRGLPDVRSMTTPWLPHVSPLSPPRIFSMLIQCTRHPSGATRADQPTGRTGHSETPAP